MFINLVWSFGRLSVRLWLAREAATQETNNVHFRPEKGRIKICNNSNKLTTRF